MRWAPDPLISSLVAAPVGLPTALAVVALLVSVAGASVVLQVESVRCCTYPSHDLLLRLRLQLACLSLLAAAG